MGTCQSCQAQQHRTSTSQDKEEINRVHVNHVNGNYYDPADRNGGNAVPAGERVTLWSPAGNTVSTELSELSMSPVNSKDIRELYNNHADHSNNGRMKISQLSSSQHKQHRQSPPLARLNEDSEQLNNEEEYVESNRIRNTATDKSSRLLPKEVKEEDRSPYNAVDKINNNRERDKKINNNSSSKSYKNKSMDERGTNNCDQDFAVDMQDILNSLKVRKTKLEDHTKDIHGYNKSWKEYQNILNSLKVQKTKLEDHTKDVHGYNKLWKEYQDIQEKVNSPLDRSQQRSRIPLKRRSSLHSKQEKPWFFGFQFTELQDKGVDKSKKGSNCSNFSLLSENTLKAQRKFYAQKWEEQKLKTCGHQRSRSNENKESRSIVREVSFGVRKSSPSTGCFEQDVIKHVEDGVDVSVEDQFLQGENDKNWKDDSGSLISDLNEDDRIENSSTTGAVFANNDYRVSHRCRPYGQHSVSNAAVYSPPLAPSSEKEAHEMSTEDAPFDERNEEEFKLVNMIAEKQHSPLRSRHSNPFTSNDGSRRSPVSNRLMKRVSINTMTKDEFLSFSEENAFDSATRLEGNEPAGIIELSPGLSTKNQPTESLAAVMGDDSARKSLMLAEEVAAQVNVILSNYRGGVKEVLHSDSN